MAAVLSILPPFAALATPGSNRAEAAAQPLKKSLRFTFMFHYSPGFRAEFYRLPCCATRTKRSDGACGLILAPRIVGDRPSLQGTTMRLGNSRESRNVEDRRGRRMHIGGRGKIGLGTIILALVAAYFGVDPSFLLQDTGPTGGTTYQEGPPPAATPESQFASRVLADTEDTWASLFEGGGQGAYRPPTLVLFSDATPTACGTGQSAMGPFYCPADRKIYLDLGFFKQLEQDLDSPGDFAQAYVIAHEVAHHVQNELGIMAQVDQLRRQVDQTMANQISVRVELQADC